MKYLLTYFAVVQQAQAPDFSNEPKPQTLEEMAQRLRRIAREYRPVEHAEMDERFEFESESDLKAVELARKIIALIHSLAKDQFGDFRLYPVDTQNPLRHNLYLGKNPPMFFSTNCEPGD